MASRRLAISSLLCNDDEPPKSSHSIPPAAHIVPETVLLAPHLRSNSQNATQKSPPNFDRYSGPHDGREPSKDRGFGSTSHLTSIRSPHPYIRESSQSTLYNDNAGAYNGHERDMGSLSQGYAGHQPQRVQPTEPFYPPSSRPASSHSSASSREQFAHYPVQSSMSPPTNYSRLPDPQSSSSTHRNSISSLVSPTLSGPGTSPQSMRHSGFPSIQALHQQDKKFGLDALVHAASQEADLRQPPSPLHVAPARPPSNEPHNHRHHHSERRSSGDSFFPDQSRSTSISPLQEFKLRPPSSHQHTNIPPQYSFPPAENERSSVDTGRVFLNPVEDLRRRSHGPSTGMFSIPRQVQEGDRSREQQYALLSHHRPESRPVREDKVQEHQYERPSLFGPRTESNSLAGQSRRYPTTPAQLYSIMQNDSAPPSLRPGRKSDPGQATRITSPIPRETVMSRSQSPRPSSSSNKLRATSIASILSPDTDFPAKRRRYSDVHSSAEEPMSAYPRTSPSSSHVINEEPLINHSTPTFSHNSNTSPRSSEPISSHGTRNITPPVHHQPAASDISSLVAPSVKDQSDKESSQKVHKPPHHVTRRSPPGSAAGRAIAARKTLDEGHAVETDVKKETTDAIFTSLNSSKRAPVVSASNMEDTKAVLKPDILVEEYNSSKVTDSRPHSKNSIAPLKDDTDEWFLNHFDDSPSKKKRSPAIHRHAPTAEEYSSSALSDTALSSKVDSTLVAVVKRMDIDTTPPADMKDLVEQPVDIDVDQAVTDLVAETLEDNESHSLYPDDDNAIDVEDELLSLVDGPSHHHEGHRNQPQREQSVLSTSSQKRRPSQHVSNGTSKTPHASSDTPHTQSSKDQDSDRISMPPPSHIEPGKGTSQKSSAAKERKKPGPKPKPKDPNAPVKPRGKPGPKPKPRNPDGSIVGSTSKNKNKAATSASARKSASIVPNITESRSRSTSVMPPVVPEVENKKEEDVTAMDEDKLYCVCKTIYDEDKCMIACDRCDEWYHTQCVNMPDLEVDLVDQFICPVCVEKFPQLCLKTTYKQRCLFGLEHSDPSSPKACHRPARGLFSKYCSDDCGKDSIRARLEKWTKKGGNKEQLWQYVKEIDKREGVVYCVTEDDSLGSAHLVQVAPQKSKTDRESERLLGLLDGVMFLRDQLKQAMEVILRREQLLELAVERAKNVELCGWDQRLCFGNEEWALYGEDVLKSYESRDSDDMDVDEGGEWWCPGQPECDRHDGWQSLRTMDLHHERDLNEEALVNLTTKEREIRKRLEDVLDPASTEPPFKIPLRSHNTKSNGYTKSKINGEIKKGKKRKTSS